MKLKLFDKKKTKHVPVAEVEGMLRTGTPEAVIRSRLKEEKYSMEDINKAIEQAKIKLGATGVPQGLKPPWEQLEPQPPALTDKPPAPTPPKAKKGPAAPMPPLTPMPSKAPEPEQPPWEPPKSAAPTQLGKYSITDLETVIRPLIEGLKTEVDSKLDSISGELRKLSATDKKLQGIVQELETVKTQLSTLSKKKLTTDYDEELAQLKGSVNSILEILKGTLPPVIKTLRELKNEKASVNKKQKEVEHLI